MKDPAPPREGSETFEGLEEELRAALKRLEDPRVPLEARLRLHTRAAAIHERMEAALEIAEKTVGEPLPPPSGEDPDFPQGLAEPYESVQQRLADTVERLGGEGLPLARVVALNRTARRLAERCEALLRGARRELHDAAGSASAPPTVRPGAPEEEEVEF